VWSKSTLPLPADVRAVPLDTPFTPDDIKLFASAIPEQRFEAFLKLKASKALAITQDGFWYTSNRASRAEAVRLSVERCSDRYQVACLLISLDGFPTHRFPRSYHVTRPFTLAGEKDMSEADKERIARIYGGQDWRALARGGSQRWYAVSGKDTEAAAVDDVLKMCRETEKVCTLHAIGNFRVGKSKG
jgi:hypothetical protein